MIVDLPPNVWLSVQSVLKDFLRFGPGDLDAEHVPDGDLVRAAAAIQRKLEAAKSSDPDVPSTSK